MFVSVLSALVPSSSRAALSSTLSSVLGEWALLEIQEPNNLFRDNLDDDSLGDLSVLLFFKSGNERKLSRIMYYEHSANLHIALHSEIFFQ